MAYRRIFTWGQSWVIPSEIKQMCATILPNFFKISPIVALIVQVKNMIFFFNMLSMNIVKGDWRAKVKMKINGDSLGKSPISLEPLVLTIWNVTHFEGIWRNFPMFNGNWPLTSTSTKNGNNTQNLCTDFSRC